MIRGILTIYTGTQALCLPYHVSSKVLEQGCKASEQSQANRVGKFLLANGPTAVVGYSKDRRTRGE